MPFCVRPTAEDLRSNWVMNRAVKQPYLFPSPSLLARFTLASGVARSFFANTYRRWVASVALASTICLVENWLAAGEPSIGIVLSSVGYLWPFLLIGILIWYGILSLLLLGWKRRSEITFSTATGRVWIASVALTIILFLLANWIEWVALGLGFLLFPSFMMSNILVPGGIHSATPILFLVVFFGLGIMTWALVLYGAFFLLSAATAATPKP